MTNSYHSRDITHFHSLKRGKYKFIEYYIISTFTSIYLKGQVAWGKLDTCLKHPDEIICYGLCKIFTNYVYNFHIKFIIYLF